MCNNGKNSRSNGRSRRSGIKMENLYQKLEEYSKKDIVPLHMPGHKRNTKMLGTQLPYNIDITEIDGFDDLHHADGIIKNIQEKAQKIYNTKKSFLLINGTTCGILAGIRSFVKKNDKILVARNCHKSVYHAIELNELKPIYVMPKTNEDGINLEIMPKEVKNKIIENPDVKLVVLTSPTYEGIISNIKEIVKICHENKIPVLVDEAHGAHLKFMNKTKELSAVDAGADIVVQSVHKTLPALTQTSLLHINGNMVNEEKLKHELSIFETSSPSYILMASIENCLDFLQQNENMFEKYEENLEYFYSKIKELKKLEILKNKLKDQYFDDGKIVIITTKTNITGKELSEILRKKYKIELEMSSVNYAIAMTSVCDSKENVERLINALIDIDAKLEIQKKPKYEFENILPIISKSIYEAEKEDKFLKIDYRKAEGRISKEYMWVYPPGIPIITPGEIISKDIINLMEQISEAGLEIRTDNGTFPEVLLLE